MLGFVDDSDNQTNQFLGEQTQEILHELLCHARANAQHWSRLLRATGGALELSKTSYHVAYWKFSKQGSPVLMNMKDEIPKLQVEDLYTGNICELEYLHPYAAHKTLGHYKEPAGIQLEQFRQLKSKSDRITEFLWTAPLTRAESWTYYSACYLPAVTYPLIGSHLTVKQLTSTQMKAMNIIIPRCGFNRNTHRSIIYGPQRLGGAGFRHLAVEQGALQLAYFLRHWRLQSQVGKMLQCTVHWMHLSVGVSYSILENPTVQLPHLESKWIASMRDFMARHQLYMQLDNPGIPPLQREHDQHIMDLLIGSNHYTATEIRKLNYCRLYLRAVTLSDLALPCGTAIDSNLLDGNPSPHSCRDNHLSVHQESPSPTEWKIWRRANLIWSTIDGNLRTPLGRWLHPPQKQRRRHYAYHHRRILWIHHEADMYTEWKRTGFVSPLFLATGTTASFEDLSNFAQPVQVQQSSDSQSWIVHDPGRPILYTPPPPHINTHPTFTHYVRTLNAWEAELLQHSETTQDSYSFCVEAQPCFRAGSDGSVRYKTQGSFGWTIRNERNERVAEGMGPARGTQVSSYRAEACGMLSILLFLIRIAEYTEMYFPWKGVIGTDSQSLLDTLHGNDVDPQQTETPMSLDGGKVVLDVLCPDWDILIEIQIALEKLPHVKLEYVKGHQDRTKPYDQLDTMAQLNVDADAKAGQYQDVHGASRPHVLMTAHARAHLCDYQGTITSHYPERTRICATAPALGLYLREKYKWSEAIFDSINWDAHRGALQKLNKKRIHITKLVFDILPTTSQANKYDNGKRTCPACDCLHEDRDHVLRCPHAKAEAWRTEFDLEISEFCRKTQTKPELQKLLQTAFAQWFQTSPEVTMLVNTEDYSPCLHSIIIQQNQIGWRQMFNGRFGNEWCRIQNAAYLNRPEPPGVRKRTGEQWQVKLIVTMWTSWEQRWADRNKALHGHDAVTRDQAQRIEVQRQLDLVYQQRPFMEPSVQELLMENAEAHTAQPLTQTRNWLAQNAGLFKESIRRVKKKALTGVRSIRTYFQPSNNGE